MASRKGVQQLRNAAMRNEPLFKHVHKEKQVQQKQQEDDRAYEKWLDKARRASHDEKKRVTRELQESDQAIASAWRTSSSASI